MGNWTRVAMAMMVTVLLTMGFVGSAAAWDECDEMSGCEALCVTRCTVRNPERELTTVDNPRFNKDKCREECRRHDLDNDDDDDDDD